MSATIIDTNEALLAEWGRRRAAGETDLMAGIELRGEPLNAPTPAIQLVITVENLCNSLASMTAALNSMGSADRAELARKINDA